MHKKEEPGFRDVLEAIHVFSTEMDQQFEQVDQRFEEVNIRFDQVDDRFDCIEKRLTRVEACMVTKEYLDEKLADFHIDFARRYKLA